MKVASAPADPPKTTRNDKLLLNLAGSAFFIMVLLGPLLTFGEDSTAALQLTGEGSLQRQIGYILILAVSIWAAMRQPRGVQALIMPWPLMLALGWCWVSIIWAIEPGIATRRLVLTTLVVWNTFIIVQSAGYQRTMTILRIVMVVLLAINFLVVAVDPSVGKHMMIEGAVNTVLVGNWRGILGHKNVAGAACAITILLYLFDARQIRPVIRVAVLAAAGYFLYMSQSKTSAGMLGIAIAAGWIFQAYDEKIRSFAIPILMVLTAVFWFLYNTYSSLIMDNYLSATAFTGRGWIWSAMLRYAADNPILGAGFGSFWNIGSDSPVYQYGQGFVREVTVGHNGYLDLLVTVGVPGMLICIFACVAWPAWRLLVSRILPQRGALAVALLLFCMGHNITESSLLARDALIGVIMMVAIAIAQNWEQVGVVPAKKAAAADVFSALAQRRREHA